MEHLVPSDERKWRGKKIIRKKEKINKCSMYYFQNFFLKNEKKINFKRIVFLKAKELSGSKKKIKIILK